MKFVAVLLLFIPMLVFAQNKPGTAIHIKKAKGEIKLDGILDEPDWQSADVAGNWFLNYPVDTALAPMQTEARLTFNEHYFYVSFVCHDDESRDLINSLRRDFDYELNDNVGFNLGPYNDRINGFFFVLTPRGVQMEGTISGAGTTIESFGISWDNKWYSKVVRYKDKWICEMAIPFKSFRYKDKIKEWNIAFDRSDKKRNHKSAWIHTPIQYTTGSFAYSGQLVWDDPIPPAHTNISLIPYIAGNASSDNEAKPATTTSGLAAGLDAKIAVTPAINLDLTLNPDFSQVEVDQQVINLTRFEFKFPERRQFFLENSDLFDRAGFPESRVFFSRRIGLVETQRGVYKRTPIAYGARMSGSLSKRWRMSVMNMQTKENLSLGLPTQNYTVATVQHNFWHQSNIAITYADKESLGVGLGDSTKYFHKDVFRPSSLNGKNQLRPNTFNRVIDADLETYNKDNTWYASAFFAKSFDDFNRTQNTSGGSFVQYNKRHINAVAGNSFVSKNYNAEAGYVPSRGVYPGQFNYFANAALKFYPKEFIVYHGPQVSLFQTYIPDGTLTDKQYSAGYSVNFINTATLLVNFNYIYSKLTSDFNPIDASKFTTFKAGEYYNWKTVSATFMSNSRKLLNVTAMGTYGGFYNGTNLNLNGQVSYRFQPYGNISMRFDYNDLRLPDNYGKEKLFLVGPRIDITFTDKIFLTTYVQYNKLLDNMNLNARFQWRYKPASDFFIVYTENYLPETFFSKNRALVFKFTYWLNL
ncbi:MAG: DUF5916 domain-containing protein [Cyclobacteriaceae bacterium]